MKIRRLHPAMHDFIHGLLAVVSFTGGRSTQRVVVIASGS